MASILALTNRLLQSTVHQPLDQFVKDHIEAGGDATSLQGSLMIATGQMYDRRTVVVWIERYAK